MNKKKFGGIPSSRRYLPLPDDLWKKIDEAGAQAGGLSWSDTTRLLIQLGIYATETGTDIRKMLHGHWQALWLDDIEKKAEAQGKEGAHAPRPKRAVHPTAKGRS